MNGYITVGDLAKQIKTSPAKLERVMRVNRLNCKLVKKTFKNKNNKTCTKMVKCILNELVEKIKILFGPKPEKPEIKLVKKVIDKEKETTELCRNPIIAQNFKTGETWGQGLEVWWAKERLR